LSATDYALVFLCTFSVVFLLGIQSRNVQQSRYFIAIVTSFLISCANFLFVHYAATGDYIVFAFSAAGGCMGIAGAIWFSDNVLHPKATHDPR